MADAENPTRSERRALCDLFDEVGPDAPTLCEGWQTFDLAAHLWVREHNPIAGMGIVIPPLAGYTDRAIERAKDRFEFTDLVDRIRQGPPFGLFRWFEEQMNLSEYFVHHEDVRRGDGSTGARPADEVATLDDRLWASLRRGARLMTRGLGGLTVELDWPDHERREARRGDATVRITGRPTEITLFLFGRKDAAEVEVTGDDDAVRRALDASLGI